MSEYHIKIHGICYKAQSDSGIPNFVLMEYLKVAGMKREYEAEFSKHVRRPGVIFSEAYDWRFCAEDSDVEND